MALIDLDSCLGPTEFVCPARGTIEIGVPSISLLLRKIIFLHPMGIDAPLDARVRRVLRQQRLLPGSASWATLESILVGDVELITQPIKAVVETYVPTEADPPELSSGIPVESFSSVGGLSGVAFGGVVAAAGKRLVFTFRSRSDKDQRLRFAVLVTPHVVPVTEAKLSELAEVEGEKPADG